MCGREAIPIILRFVKKNARSANGVNSTLLDLFMYGRKIVRILGRVPLHLYANQSIAPCVRFPCVVFVGIFTGIADGSTQCLCDGIPMGVVEIGDALFKGAKGMNKINAGAMWHR